MRPWHESRKVSIMETKKMKPNNDLLREAYELQELVKSAEKRLKEIKEMVKPYGPYSTSEYSAMVTTRIEERLVGKAEFITLLGRAFLEEKKLIHKDSKTFVTFARKLV